MNKIQERRIEIQLETCLANFRMGWGKHELHDHLVVILAALDVIAGVKHTPHPSFANAEAL